MPSQSFLLHLWAPIDGFYDVFVDRTKIRLQRSSNWSMSCFVGRGSGCSWLIWSNCRSFRWLFRSLWHDCSIWILKSNEKHCWRTCCWHCLFHLKDKDKSDKGPVKSKGRTVLLDELFWARQRNSSKNQLYRHFLSGWC